MKKKFVRVMLFGALTDVYKRQQIKSVRNVVSGCVIKVVLMQKSIMCGCRILWFIPLKSNQGITPTCVPYIRCV